MRGSLLFFLIAGLFFSTHVVAKDQCIIAAKKITEGRTLARKGELVEEEKLYREALDLCPTSGEASFNLAVNLFEQRRFPEASVALISAQEKQQNASQELLAARILALQGTAETSDRSAQDKSIDLLQRALKKYPDDWGLLSELSAIYLSEDKPKEALSVLESLIQKDPQEVRHRINAARAQIQLGFSEQAISTMEKVVELAPGEGKYRAILGTLYREDAQPEKALSTVLGVSTVEATLERARAYRNLGQLEQALLEYTKISEQHSAASAEIQIIAVSESAMLRCLSLAECPESIKGITELLIRNPGDQKLLVTLSSLYLISNDLSHAEETLLKVKEDSSDALKNRAVLLEKKGKKEEARKLYQEIAARTPKSDLFISEALSRVQ